ncbi:MAG: type II toxin-antitoxin system VapC family toxin [Thermodesulfobacteriota bacterium]|nr:type II toxin-antitoxin system VapC family toxin [Thermodesulfobacteriota bacterium]
MTYYFDTSALVKIYHTEAGSTTVQPIYRGTDEIIISELGKIEYLSTVHRKYREQEISHDALLALIAKFEADLQQRYTVLRFSLLVIDEGWNFLRRFAETRGLKTLDSLQFAFFTIYCDTTTHFVCADATLGDIVKNEGYQLVAP